MLRGSKLLLANPGDMATIAATMKAPMSCDSTLRDTLTAYAEV